MSPLFARYINKDISTNCHHLLQKALEKEISDMIRPPLYTVGLNYEKDNRIMVRVQI